MKNNIRLLYLHNFLTDFRFHSAFAIIYLAQITGSYTLAMSVFAFETIISAVMDIPTGIFSDRIGRKYTLVAGSVFMTVSIACYAFAHDVMHLYAAAAFYGIGNCLFSGNNDALLYETLKSENKEEQFYHYQGRTSSMFQLALGLSALCASVITGFGLRFIFIIGIIPQALAAIVSLFFTEPRVHIHKERNSWEHMKTACLEVYRNPRLLLLVFGSSISWGAGEANFNFMNVFVSKLWPLWAVGLYRAMNNGIGFISFWFSGRILERIKPNRMLILAQIYWFISQGIAVLMQNVISPILLLSSSALYGPSMVARGQLMQEEFTDHQRATMGSIASFANSIMFTVLAFGVGLISDRFGPAAGVGFGVLMAALSLPIFMKLFHLSLKPA